MMVQRFGSPPRRKRIACVVLLSGFLGCLPADGRAAGLECPEVGPGAVPNLLAHFKQPQLVASGNSVDLANEIYDAINRLQIERPNISYTELTNVLIAAYCPLKPTSYPATSRTSHAITARVQARRRLWCIAEARTTSPLSSL
jgi:hypothetical protein